jgi:hypothetical protein
MNVEPPETLVIIESIVYKSNGFAISIKLIVEFLVSDEDMNLFIQNFSCALIRE